jgi:hypothetical protein
VSETSEATQPRRWRIAAPYIQYRRRNTEGRRFGTRTSPWVIDGGHRNAIISDELIHPDDLAHLLQAKLTPALGGGPMLEEIPAS